MKKLLIIAGILLLTGSSSLAIDDAVKLSGKDLITFSQNEKWGIKDKNGNIIIDPIYLKMIRLGDSSWIVQNKKRKFGLIDNKGNILVPIKYNHADRVVSKFAKFGNNNDYGIYDENGKIIVKNRYFIRTNVFNIQKL